MHLEQIGFVPKRMVPVSQGEHGVTGNKQIASGFCHVVTALVFAIAQCYKCNEKDAKSSFYVANILFYYIWASRVSC